MSGNGVPGGSGNGVPEGGGNGVPPLMFHRKSLKLIAEKSVSIVSKTAIFSRLHLTSHIDCAITIITVWVSYQTRSTRV